MDNTFSVATKTVLFPVHPAALPQRLSSTCAEWNGNVDNTFSVANESVIGSHLSTVGSVKRSVTRCAGIIVVCPQIHHGGGWTHAASEIACTLDPRWATSICFFAQNLGCL